MHKSVNNFILIDMNLFCCVKNFCIDVWDDLRCNVGKIVLCCVVFCAVLVAGIALYNAKIGTWWSDNRYNYVCSLIYYGICRAVICTVVTSMLFSLLLVVSSLNKYCGAIKYIALLVVGLYYGGFVAALFEKAVTLGIIYTVFYVLLSGAGFTMAVFLNCCNHFQHSSSFCQAVSDNKKVMLDVLAVQVVKLLLLIVLLKPITSVL